jgi:hypothetical protein
MLPFVKTVATELEKTTDAGLKDEPRAAPLEITKETVTPPCGKEAAPCGGACNRGVLASTITNGTVAFHTVLASPRLLRWTGKKVAAKR